MNIIIKDLDEQWNIYYSLIEVHQNEDILYENCKNKSAYHTPSTVGQNEIKLI